jgi:hypothetical protein
MRKSPSRAHRWSEGDKGVLLQERGKGFQVRPLAGGIETLSAGERRRKDFILSHF